MRNGRLEIFGAFGFHQPDKLKNFSNCSWHLKHLQFYTEAYKKLGIWFGSLRRSSPSILPGNPNSTVVRVFSQRTTGIRSIRIMRSLRTCTCGGSARARRGTQRKMNIATSSRPISRNGSGLTEEWWFTQKRTHRRGILGRCLLVCLTVCTRVNNHVAPFSTHGNNFFQRPNEHGVSQKFGQPFAFSYCWLNGVNHVPLLYRTPVSYRKNHDHLW